MTTAWLVQNHKAMQLLKYFVVFTVIFACAACSPQEAIDNTAEGERFAQYVEIQECYFYIRDTGETDISKIEERGYFKNLPETQRQALIADVVELYRNRDGE